MHDEHPVDGGDPELTDYITAGGMNIARVRLGQGRYYEHSDHLGSPVTQTRNNGGLATRTRYTPFGLEMDTAGLLKDQGGFTGHIKDSATDLNYMQARYYDPVIGRFLSIDPVTFMENGNPGYFNRYAYTMNDRLNFTDPTGKSRRGARQKSQVQRIRNAEYSSLVQQLYNVTGVPSATPTNFNARPRHLKNLRQLLQHARQQAEIARWENLSPAERAAEGQLNLAIYGERLGSIYRIPGSGTTSELPYTGRAFNPGSRNAKRRDSRDGLQAEIVETGIPSSLLPIREQIHLNASGGVRRSDNMRNEKRESEWPPHGIGPPPPPSGN